MKFASITERLADHDAQKWALHAHARQMATNGEEVIELTIGEPDIEPDIKLLAECQRAMFAGRTRYSNGRGEPSIVEALAKKYSMRSGREITVENILCFPGTQTALFACMLALVENGDGVLVGDPLYATYEDVIRATGATLEPVHLHSHKGFRLQVEDLQAAITPSSRVLLLNYPHNPTGAILSHDEIAEIGALCAKHEITILSDEVYEELIFEGEFSSPFDIPELAERTIVVSSISKSHAVPGFRSGWAVGPSEFGRKLLPLSETMLFGGQPFIADMTALALSKNFDTAERMRNAYKRRANLVIDAFCTNPNIKQISPKAGMFILLDVSGSGMNGHDFAWGLLNNQHVATMPGSSFGDQASHFIRLSLTVPDSMLVEACSRINRFEKYETL